MELRNDAVDELARRIPLRSASGGCLGLIVCACIFDWAWNGLPASPVDMVQQCLRAFAITYSLELARRISIFVVALWYYWRWSSTQQTPLLMKDVKRLLRASVDPSLLLILLLGAVALGSSSFNFFPPSTDLAVYYGLIPALLLARVSSRLSASTLELIRDEQVAGAGAVGEGFAWTLHANFLLPMAELLKSNDYRVRRNGHQEDDLPLSDAEKIIFVLVPIQHRVDTRHQDREALGAELGTVTLFKDHLGQKGRPFVLSYFAHPQNPQRRLLVTYAAPLATMDKMQTLTAFTTQDAEREAKRMARKLQELFERDAAKNRGERMHLCCYHGSAESIKEFFIKDSSALSV